MSIEAQREELIHSLMRHFDKLHGLRNFLTPTQTFFVAEELRNLADDLDHGLGDRVRGALPPHKSGIEPPPLPTPPLAPLSPPQHPVLMLSPTLRVRMPPRLVKTGRYDIDGEPLYKIFR
jgi:hypothetical protein